MTREEVEALIETAEETLHIQSTAAYGSTSVVIPRAQLRSFISLARLVPVLEAALEPFAAACFSDEEGFDFNVNGPADDDWRNACAALTPATEEEYGRSPGMDALPEAERVRLFRREETSGVIGYGRRKALFMALTDAFAFPDQTDLTPLVEGLHALNASIAPDQTDATVGSGDMPAEIWSYPFDPETDGNGAWTPGGPGRRFGAGFTRYVRADAPPPVTGGEWPDDLKHAMKVIGMMDLGDRLSQGQWRAQCVLRDYALLAIAPPPAQASSPKPEAENICKHSGKPARQCEMHNLHCSAPDCFVKSATPPEITDEVVARFHVIFWDLYNSGKNASTAMRRVLTEFQKSGGVG